jgi:4-deoxy-L-threo-5-hexosulose-uronate ketol-isomerase
VLRGLKNRKIFYKKRITMEIRHNIHMDHAKRMTTEELRKHLLIQNLFLDDEIKMYYIHIDRIIVAGVKPIKKELKLEMGNEIGADFFLARRELGIINIGEKGMVKVDGKEYILESRDGLYIGMGVKDVAFSSADSKKPAKFYLNSAPAHMTYPTVKINIKDAEPQKLGDLESSNKRTIYKYIVPGVVQSCQLTMGLTILDPQNMWNTMPCHTHDRRMEVYLYFDMPKDSVVFHLIGEPTETRHIVMRNEEAVIMPSWSIHSGVGTKNYTFIWGMVGENQTFSDMDFVPMDKIM